MKEEGKQIKKELETNDCKWYDRHSSQQTAQIKSFKIDSAQAGLCVCVSKKKNANSTNGARKQK